MSKKPTAIPGGSRWPSAQLGVDGKFARADSHMQIKERNGLTFSGAALSFDYYRVKEGIRKTTDSQGTSIFDPVLCELIYRWFCPLGGLVLDPFAGGSVRGIVAAVLGREYIGIDLSAQQIEANKEQWMRIQQNGGISGGDIISSISPENYDTLIENDAIKHGVRPIKGQGGAQWIEGDAREIHSLCLGLSADLIFTCPPYGDLERYSDDPRDLSTLDYEQFLAAYRQIIMEVVALLKADRFACFVVGDIRGKDGLYRKFPWHTMEAFEAAGVRLYNEAVLVTAVGSLPIRAGKPFESSRKLGKTHQNVLVFIKGDPRKATEAIGPVECGDSQENCDHLEM